MRLISDIAENPKLEMLGRLLAEGAAGDANCVSRSFALPLEHGGSNRAVA